MNKNVKVVYYVDIDDNTKGCLCAIPSDKDLRDSSVIQKVADEIKNVFEPIHQLMGEHSVDLAIQGNFVSLHHNLKRLAI